MAPSKVVQVAAFLWANFDLWYLEFELSFFELCKIRKKLKVPRSLWNQLVSPGATGNATPLRRMSLPRLLEPEGTHRSAVPVTASGFRSDVKCGPEWYGMVQNGTELDGVRWSQSQLLFTGLRLWISGSRIVDDLLFVGRSYASVIAKRWSLNHKETL